MLRSHRCIIVGIAGLILIGSSKAPQPPAKAEQQQSQAKSDNAAPDTKAMPAKASKQVQTAKNSQPCGNGRYRSDGDLCAQWKAADAARDAANWAWWQLGLSALGVLGLGLTLWFNFRALKLAEGASEETKDALVIAERNADAAIKMVEQAEITALQQLRAYVFPTSLNFFSFAAGHAIAAQMTFANNGNTPARNVVAWFAIKVGPIDALDDFFVRPDDSLDNFIGVLIPRQSCVRNKTTPEEVRPELFKSFGGRTQTAYLFGEVTYLDTFKKDRISRFRVCYDPDLGPHYLVACPQGNEVS